VFTTEVRPGEAEIVAQEVGERPTGIDTGRT
jgi:hypothetical protein